MSKYKKYEYCKSVGCECLIPESKEHGIAVTCMFSHPEDCVKTAKDFHRWLKKNNFEIIKENKKEVNCTCKEFSYWEYKWADFCGSCGKLLKKQ